MSMREELDGNIEALNLLPEAEESERIAQEDFSQACEALSDARTNVALELSRSVTNILPSLGLEGSTFKVQLGLRSGGLNEPYYGSESIGVDIADFLLLHQKRDDDNSGSSRSAALGEAGVSQHGGSIEQVGSSGEKSRVLLAIETVIPGSIGSACNSLRDGVENVSREGTFRAPPISIVYDEIDAHVGGRAAVTMAKLLADQSRGSRSREDGMTSDSRSQIIAITHSASLAAIADRHIVVERCHRNGSHSSTIRTYVADGSSRRKEIARMASGDLASDEAETFADALIRDALLQKSM
jgi:DNA repair protein RecN (Recombination protein N)